MSNSALQKQANQSVTAGRMEAATHFTPLVDVIETGEGFLFQADLPGVRAGDLDVSYDNGTLTIAGKAEPRHSGGQGYIWQEYGVGHFYRQFTLGTPIDVDGIRASLKDGVLELHVPKAASAKTRRIELRTA